MKNIVQERGYGSRAVWVGGNLVVTVAILGLQKELTEPKGKFKTVFCLGYMFNSLSTGNV